MLDNSYISYMGFCIAMLHFLKINCFSKALLDPEFPVIAMQRFDLKKSIIV